MNVDWSQNIRSLMSRQKPLGLLSLASDSSTNHADSDWWSYMTFNIMQATRSP